MLTKNDIEKFLNALINPIEVYFSNKRYVRPSEGFEPSSSGFFQQYSILLSTAAYTDQAILRRPFNIGLMYLEYIIVR